ncbi:MAG: LysR family transcriptional regulator [Treponema sp.]|jgi:lysyl-tRNA synthetase class 2|nr:LysR family transcriptional regulator [Treponema sp.]
MDVELLWERARIIRRVRDFFDRKQYLETDTPLLAPDLIPETCLEVFQTARVPPPESAIQSGEPCWLIPSPELWMKRLIARHGVSMYQICKCFRNGESTGRLHSPEFTMLEYYTMDADYLDSLDLTEELFVFLLENQDGERPAPPGSFPPFLRITVADAFSRWAGFDLYAAAERGPAALAGEARRLGLDPPPGLDTAALYDLIFVHAVEPKLPRDRPAALLDYPAFVPCLAKRGKDRRTVERWELYVNGVELANCYSEETDAEAVRRYFDAEGAAKRRHALVPHAVDGGYWKLFLPKKNAAGETIPFPRCSGVAMGLDRLVMALTGRKTIDGVLPFPLREQFSP